jgi:hypothetical protein
MTFISSDLNRVATLKLLELFHVKQFNHVPLTDGRIGPIRALALDTLEEQSAG